MTNRKLLKAARIWDGASPELLYNGFLLVKDGKIEALGLQSDLGVNEELAAGAEVYELEDCTLLPGLINMHTHLTFNASDAVLADHLREKAAGLPTMTIRALDNMQRSLKIGVTTIRDCGTLNAVAFSVRAAVESGLLIGPRVVASGDGITTTGGHCYYFGIEADSADEVRKAVRSQVKAGADFIKIFATGGNLTPGTNQYEAQYSEEELKVATAEARRLGRKVASHAHGTPGIRNSVAAGVDTIEHCSFITPDGVEYDPDIAEEIARQEIFVVPTFSIGLNRKIMANPNYGKDNPSLARFIASRPYRYQNTRRLFDLGVVLVSGSDSGIPGVPFDDFVYDLAILVNDLGLTPYQTLLTATAHAARACGLSDTGTLAAGKRADLLAVAGNPLEKIEDLAATRLVAANGRVAVWKPELIQSTRPDVVAGL
jgi:imidazolonepropionase-like amidohydrolase